MAATPGGLDAAERADVRGRLTAALAQLPPVQRQVLVLHDLGGLEHAEVAGLLGISAGTSRVYLHHARRAVRAAPGVRALRDE